MKKERHSRRLKEDRCGRRAGITRTGKRGMGARGSVYARGGAALSNAVRELHIEFREAGAKCCKRSPSTPVATKLATVASRKLEELKSLPVRVPAKLQEINVWSRQYQPAVDVRAQIHRPPSRSQNVRRTA